MGKRRRAEPQKPAQIIAEMICPLKRLEAMMLHCHHHPVGSFSGWLSGVEGALAIFTHRMRRFPNGELRMLTGREVRRRGWRMSCAVKMAALARESEGHLCVRPQGALPTGHDPDPPGGGRDRC